MTDNQSDKQVISTELLEFDRSNPRLVSIGEASLDTDKEIMVSLIDLADIPELIDSILSNTYMDIEPLIVTKKDTVQSGNFRVLEGNRRLCAIKLLKDPALARECKISVPQDIPSNVLSSLNQVTVYEVEDEKESRSFIGFKHINGPHRWEPYAKAIYLLDWYLAEFENGITIEDIAKQLGDQNQSVRILISAMLVLNQAEGRGLFSISDRTKPGRFGFSHLYTALTRREYQEFLSLESDWNNRPSINPIAQNAEDNLGIVLHYIYGSIENSIDAVVKSQNPDLKQLGQVLVNPVAFQTLKSTNELNVAYDEILPSAIVFRDSLILANTKVKDTLSKCSSFSIEDKDILIGEAKILIENAENILALMNLKIEKSKS